MPTVFPASDVHAARSIRETIAQIWGLLAPPEKRSALRMVALMFLAMAFETLGVGLFVPAIAVLADPAVVTSLPKSVPLPGLLTGASHETLIIAALVTLVTVYLTKAILISYLAWRQSRFAHRVQARLSHDLLNRYLAQPYAFHLQRNSAQLIRNALNGVDTFTDYGLVAGQKLAAELLVLVGISGLLIALEPFAALLALPPLLTLAWAFHRLTHERARNWGDRRKFHEVKRLQNMQQALGAVKEIKLAGSEEAFVSRYQNDNVEVSRAAEHHHTLIQFPRIAFELFAVLAIVTLAVGLIASGRSPETLLPTLGLFSAAAFRLIPSANRAVMAHHELRYGSASIGELHAEVRDLVEPPRTSSIQPAEPFVSLSVQRLGFAYPGNSQSTLHEVSFDLNPRETVAIVGASGAGKSSLVDVVLGLLTPTSGHVLVNGRDVQSRLRAWQSQIGYVPQSIFLSDDTIRNNIAFGMEPARIDDDAVWAAVRAARLQQFVSGLPQGLDTPVGERGVRLSGGERQRIAVARALYRNPPVLVLDEATSSLDAATERELMEAVKDLSGTRAILIVAHRASTIVHADRLYHLAGGRIVGQGPSALLATNAAPAQVEAVH